MPARGQGTLAAGPKGRALAMPAENHCLIIMIIIPYSIIIIVIIVVIIIIITSFIIIISFIINHDHGRGSKRPRVGYAGLNHTGEDLAGAGARCHFYYC